MIESIARSRGVGLRRALIGLAIPMASEATATRLCRAGYRTLEEVADAGEEALQQVEDIGPKVAASLHAHLNRESTRAELARLRELGVDLDVLDEDLPPPVAEDAPLAGKTVVVTGAIADPRSGEKVARPVFQRLCERAGATTASSVSANTDLLICGANVGASKTAKAEKLGVEVVDQAEIWEQLIGAGIAERRPARRRRLRVVSMPTASPDFPEGCLCRVSGLRRDHGEGSARTRRTPHGWTIGLSRSRRALRTAVQSAVDASPRVARPAHASCRCRVCWRGSSSARSSVVSRNWGGCGGAPRACRKTAGSWCWWVSRGSARRAWWRGWAPVRTPRARSFCTGEPTSRRSPRISRSSRRCDTTRRTPRARRGDAGSRPWRRGSWRGSFPSSAPAVGPQRRRDRHRVRGRRHELFDAFARLLLHPARSQRLLIVLEDLHWADAPTLLLLREVVRRGAGSPLLVIATYSDLEADASGPLARVLADLRRDDAPGHDPPRAACGSSETAALVAAHCGRGQVDRRLAQRLRDQTGGNPFFIEELLHARRPPSTALASRGRQGGDRPAAGSAVARDAGDADAGGGAGERLPPRPRCRRSRPTGGEDELLDVARGGGGGRPGRGGSRGGRPLLVRPRARARDAL